ncbi:MAG TPA: nuclear transport factor 2 family protein [Mycobacteriales bacterium]|jgi:hypothetical protein|nr:nuclear transport factor 2 family protein [Mycobacteriales bacterium]
MATDANLDLIHSVYAAFGRHDLPAVLNMLAPDVAWIHPEGMVPYGTGGTTLGHEGVTAFLAKVPTVIAAQKVEPQEFIVDGDRVIVFGSRHVTAHNGKSGILRFIHSWTLRDGRIIRLEDAFDTVEMHRLLTG